MLGGAHIQAPPRISDEAGVLVLMNHQSVLDIPLVVSALPMNPRKVTRARHAYHNPLISHMIRLYQYPVVESTATVCEHLKGVQKSVRDSPVPAMLYREGTRMRDGRLGIWREGALRVILGAWKWTVHIIIADGFGQTFCLMDFMKKMSSIDSRLAAVGPFVGPEPGADIDPLIADMRVRMEVALTGFRSEVCEG